MSSVRAKFVCVGKDVSDTGTQVTMWAVTNGCEENKAFNDATPGGNLSIHIAPDKPAADLFELNKEYYLDFTPAE